MTKVRVTKDFLHEGDITIISRRWRGVARFSADFLCLTVPKLSYVKPLVFHFFWVLKNFIHKRDISRFCVETFLFLSTEKFLRGTFLCFRKFLVNEKN